MMPGGDRAAYRADRADPDGMAAKVDRPSVLRLYRPRRRRALRQDGAQRHRIRRHAAHRRDLRPLQIRLRPLCGARSPTSSPNGNRARSIPTSSTSPPRCCTRRTKPARRSSTPSLTRPSRRERDAGPPSRRSNSACRSPRSPRRSSPAPCRRAGTCASRRRRVLRIRAASPRPGGSRRRRGHPRRALRGEDRRLRPGLPADEPRPADNSAGASTSREIAAIWRGGCIIRARMLDRIMEAYEREPALASLLLAEHFRDAVAGAAAAWRKVVALAIAAGVATPAFSSTLAYFDGFRRAPRASQPAAGPARLFWRPHLSPARQAWRLSHALEPGRRRSPHGLKRACRGRHGRLDRRRAGAFSRDEAADRRHGVGAVAIGEPKCARPLPSAGGPLRDAAVGASIWATCLTGRSGRPHVRLVHGERPVMRHGLAFASRYDGGSLRRTKQRLRPSGANRLAIRINIAFNDRDKHEGVSRFAKAIITIQSARA